MAEKDFKVKSGLIVGGLSTGIVKNPTAGSALTASAVDLATSEVTGTLTAGKGGTGVANSGTITVSGNITLGSSTHTLAFVTTGNTSVTLPTSGTLAINPTTTIGDIIYASATGTPGTLARLAGNTATQPSFLTSTGNGTANTTTSFTSSTGSGNVVLAGSPALSGTPTAPTASVDTNTTQIATTAFVLAQASAVNPAALGTVAIGTSTRYARADHVHPTTGLGLTSGTLAQFAATTSSQLAGVISDETGSGALVFGTSPVIGTPTIDTINASSATATTSIHPNVTTGSITIGAGITTGTINIAASGSGANSINLGNANTTVVVNGNLTVNGTTTTVNSTTISVDDKNLELGSVASPTDVTADGGGITLKGTTDKTFNWVDATDAWTSSEHLNLASGKAYRVNGTEVISSSGGWSGSVITVAKGGTNISSYAVGDILYADGATSLAKLAGVAVGNVLLSGGVTTAPSWGKVLLGGANNHITGTLAVANGGTGQTSYTDGQLLIGNTSGNTLTKATLTAGTGISITNGNGSITIASSGPTVSTFTLSAATATAVDTTTASGVEAIEYTLSLMQGTGTAMKMRTSKILAHYNSGLASPVVDFSEFAIVETGSALMAGINVAAVLNGANIELQVTVTDANTTNVTCKIYKVVLS